MEWSGLPAAAWSKLESLVTETRVLQREEWFGPTVIGLVAGLLALCLWQAVRVWKLKRSLAAQTLPSRTLYHAILATREARAKGAAATSANAGHASGGGRRRRAPQHPVQPNGPSPPAVAADAETCHVKIYIDYSNLILNWKRTDALGVDWDQLPPVVLRSLQRLPACAGKQIVYCGTNVYGSYYPSRYYDLLEAIENGSARSITMPFQVYKRQRMREDAVKAIPAGSADAAAEADRIVKARLRQELAQWRQENAAETELLARTLPNKFGYLSFPFERRTPHQLRTAHYTSDGVPIAHEKGLDVRCCVDLMADGASGMFDVAVIVSNDSDFVPAVSFVNDELGKPVIQLGPRAISDVMRSACGGHIDLEDVITQVNANRGVAPSNARKTPATSQETILSPAAQRRPESSRPADLQATQPAPASSPPIQQPPEPPRTQPAPAAMAPASPLQSQPAAPPDAIVKPA